MEVNFSKSVTIRKVGLRSLQFDKVEEQVDNFVERLSVDARKNRGWQCVPGQITMNNITNEDVEEFRAQEAKERKEAAIESFNKALNQYNKLVEDNAAAVAAGKAPQELPEKPTAPVFDEAPVADEAETAAAKDSAETPCYAKEYLVNLDIVCVTSRKRRDDVLEKEFADILHVLRTAGRGKHWLVVDVTDTEYEVEQVVTVRRKGQLAAV